MNKFYIFILLLFSSAFVNAQIQVVSIGPSYSNQTFYSLDDGSTSTEAGTKWDLAFGIADGNTAIFINEAAASSQAGIELYVTYSTDFDNLDTFGMEQVFNPDQSWTDGALNQLRLVTDPLDTGWGYLNESNGEYEGFRTFLIKLRNGSQKKLEINSFINGVYTFRYANLNGTDEVISTINKVDYTGKTLAYYSMTTAESFDLEPNTWDFYFTRYSAALAVGTDVVQYTVAGVFTNSAIEVAQADDIDVQTVDHLPYLDSFSNHMDAIGHDWKEFDLGNFAWVVQDNRAYFVKTASNDLWKVVFTGFGGSSSGSNTFVKVYIGQLSAVENQAIPVTTFGVFPNPTTNYINMSFDAKIADDQSRIKLINNLGQVVFDKNVIVNQGLNTKTINFDLNPGLYYATLQIKGESISKQIFIK